MRLTLRSTRRRQRGLTLIESMVALLVISIGLLGIAALQLSAMQQNATALNHSQAVWINYNMADRIRANPNQFASYAHGSKGFGIISTSSHHPGRVRTYSGQKIAKEDLIWGPPTEPNPYDMEWVDLIEAIRTDTPYNEVKRGAEASLVTSMGRMAAHTGQIITYDQILNSDHEFAPDVDKLTLDSPAPLQMDSNGKYPVPLPGINKRREYGV